MTIWSLKVTCVFLAMVFSVSRRRHTGKVKELCLLSPGVYRFYFRKSSKKAASVKDAAFPPTLCAVQVAPQRCPIPHIDKHFYYNWLLESIQALRKLLIDKNAKKKDLRLSNGMSTNALTKPGRNEHISTEIFTKICEMLDRG